MMIIELVIATLATTGVLPGDLPLLLHPGLQAGGGEAGEGGGGEAGEGGGGAVEEGGGPSLLHLE